MELGAIEELVIIYSELYEKGITKDITKKAKCIYNELIPGHTLLSEVVNSAVGKLFSVAYPNVDPDRKIPSNEEIKKIISNLNKLKQELEK